MILLTGYNGFLGKYLLTHFEQLNKRVIKIGRGIDNDWFLDFEKCKGVIPPGSIPSNNIDQLIHAAGLAHFVPKNDKQRALFNKINVEGTRFFLSSLSASGYIPRRFVFISTIAVYGDYCDLNKTIYPYPSVDDLDSLQVSPYGRSKLLAEELIRFWCRNNGCECIIWRIPLIVGNNAPGNLGAMEKAIKNGYYFRIGDSYSRFRYYIDIEYISKLLTDESLNKQEDNLMQAGTHNVFSGIKSYGDFEDEFAKKYNRKLFRLPMWFVFVIAIIGSLIPGFPMNYYRYKKLLNTNTVL